MKRIVLAIVLLLALTASVLCLSLAPYPNYSESVIVESISLGGTGDNYSVSPAKVEITRIKNDSVVEIPIGIYNKDSQLKTYQLNVVSPISGEISQGYTAYPVNGINTFFSQGQSTITIEGGKRDTVNFYVAKVDKIPNTQLWVNVSVETNNQITSAYIVNVLIKGDKK